MLAKTLALILLLLITKTCYASDYQNVEFIKSFIENEMKPTHLMFDLCWKKSAEVKLVKAMSAIGVRSCQSHQPSKLLDQGHLFLLDLDCSDSENVLSKAIEKELFRSPYRWLMLTSLPEVEAESMLERVPALADSDVVLAARTDNGFRMAELHRPAPQASLRSTMRGYFNKTFVDIRPHRALFRRRRDLLGYPLTMAVVIQDSNTTRQHLETRLEPQHDYIAKVSWLNVRLGFQMLNATPRYIWAYRWGYVFNGSWSGMIDDMRRGKADVGTNLLVKADRMDVVTYTDNLAPFRVRFILRQPPLSYVANIFSLPFSAGVWLALLVCTLASFGGVWAATRWEAKFKLSPHQLDGSFSDALLITMSAFSQQGCSVEPHKPSGRIMSLIMFMTLMATYAAYSAYIVVLLQAPSSTIRTLAQLGASSLTLAANDVDYNHIILKLYSRQDAIHQKVYKKIENEKRYYHLQEGVQKIRQGLFAFHSIVEPVYRQVEDTFQEHEKCDLVEVDYLGAQDAFTPVAKNSSYLELLRVVCVLFKQIQESGIKQAVVQRQQTPKPKCAAKGAMFSSVGLTDLMPVIILMLYGAAVSVVILLAEILVHKVNSGARWA
ncbi:ligand-gated ion channel domain-containing protein [Phthorimaea operculella]|nr:ligand-gated ion channel domain-containing protein [Phthorimaea operculella]